jgi:AraC-like DNA-binding protein
MTFGSNLLFFFSALGAFNAFLVGFYLLIKRRQKALSSFFLGALLIALCIRTGKSVAYFFDYELSRTVLQLGLTACLFIGPFLYFFTKSALAKYEQIPASWKLLLITWSALAFGVGVTYPYKDYPDMWGQYLVPVIYSQWALYIGCTAVVVKPVFWKWLKQGEKLLPADKWVLAVWATVLVIFLGYLWAYMGVTRGSYLSGPLFFSLATYFAIFTFFHRRRSAEPNSDPALKNSNFKLDEVEAGEVELGLKKLMELGLAYRNSRLKISDVAAELHLPAYRVSRVLNERMKKSFTAFVNEYRIEAACRMLKSDSHFTIEAIGVEVGFHSKSAFFAAFKKIKGLTPNAYLKQTGSDL